jgi:hypothetical protein
MAIDKYGLMFWNKNDIMRRKIKLEKGSHVIFADDRKFGLLYVQQVYIDICAYDLAWSLACQGWFRSECNEVIHQLTITYERIAANNVWPGASLLMSAFICRTRRLLVPTWIDPFFLRKSTYIDIEITIDAWTWSSSLLMAASACNGARPLHRLLLTSHEEMSAAPGRVGLSTLQNHEITRRSIIDASRMYSFPSRKWRARVPSIAMHQVPTRPDIASWNWISPSPIPGGARIASWMNLSKDGNVLTVTSHKTNLKWSRRITCWPLQLLRFPAVTLALCWL